jgi:hypothetical protein
VRSALYLLAPPIAVFGLYVAANLAAGVPPLPVSGTAKTSFHFGVNARAVVDTLLAPFGGVFGLTIPDGWKLRSRLLIALLAGCLLSIVLAVAPLARRWGARRNAAREPIDIWLPLVSFFLVRLSYYLAFVKLSHQGFWYYADIAVALSAVVLLQIKFFARMRPWWKAVAASLWLVVYVQSTQRFVDFTSKYGWCPHLLHVQAPRITQCLKAREPDPKLLDSSDGVFAFFLDLPAQPGTGLTANAAGYRVIRAHGLATYYDSLIRDGYLVNAWSRLCDSGRVGASIVERPIDCRQHRALELYRLKPR